MLGAVSCPHIAASYNSNLQHKLAEKIEHRNRIDVECDVCEKSSGNLWMCLEEECLRIFCSDVPPNHALEHHKKEPSHCLQMNLMNLRIWCHGCNAEIEESPQHKDKAPRGLVGLQNLGNTCYMNAALQSLANTQPLVDHFLSMSVGVTPRPHVTRAFHRLLVEMWSRSEGYIVPHALLYAIRHTHPMYRGFQQHDSQEFLRCLLDQIHEEMKVPSLEPLRHDSFFYYQEETSDVENMSSEAEDYETCDSGVSEQSSQSDHFPKDTALSRSPSPVALDMVQWKSKLHHNALGSPSWSWKQITYRSIISDVFNGTLLSSVQCLTCNRVSSRVETFQDLSLPIPSRDTIYILHKSSVPSGAGHTPKCSHLLPSDQGWLWWLWDYVCYWIWGPQVTLHDCLSAFFSADELKGDNMYSCDKCQVLRNGVKYSRLLTCPEVLCIHLKRFRHEPSLPSKISSHVSFPVEGLDLAPYIAPDCSSGTTKYDLSSVICHHGQGGSSGHYTCIARNRTTGGWYEYDDLSVTPAQNVASARAYILFYRKNDAKISRTRKKAFRLEETSSLEKERYYVSKEWLVKFTSFSEPGPVENRLLVCQHGSLLPGVETVVVSATVWRYLITRFGGGPECPADKVGICDVCSEISGGDPGLLRVQLHEFHRLKGHGGREAHQVARTWLSSWESYVKGRSTLPPGPVVTATGACVGMEVSSGQWSLLTALYGVAESQEPSLTSDSDSRSLDERISVDNLDSGIWVQNITEKGDNQRRDQS